MKIKDLQTGSTVSFTAKVKAIEDVRQLKTKFGMTSLTVAVLEDDTGTVKLNLWGSQSEGINEEAVLEINNGFVKEFQGEKQISVGKTGSIKVV